MVHVMHGECSWLCRPLAFALVIAVSLCGCGESPTTTTTTTTTQNKEATTTAPTPTPPPPPPPPPAEPRVSIDLSGPVSSIAFAGNGQWLATGGTFTILYDLTDLSDVKIVENFLEGASSNLSPVGATPVISDDGRRLSVQQTDPTDGHIITEVQTYSIDTSNNGRTELIATVATPNSCSRIAMAESGSYLVTTPLERNNPVKVYTWQNAIDTGSGEWVPYVQSFARFGAASQYVSVAFSEYDGGVLAVSVPPYVVPYVGEVPGDFLVVDSDGTTFDIEDDLVAGSVGSVTVSQDGSLLATWDTAGGVYDIINKHLCGEFSTSEYTSLQVPFALSRTGGWFAEATETAVSLFKVLPSPESCTLSLVARLDLDSVSAVAFGGAEWLAVTGRKPAPCRGGCQVLQVYNVQELAGE